MWRSIARVLPWIGAVVVIRLLFILQHKSNKKMEQKSDYIIKNSGLILIIGGVGVVVFGALIVLAVWTKQTSPGILVVFGGMFLVSLYGLVECLLYYVEVKGDEIIYRSFIGVTKRYTFAMITSGKYTKSGSFKVYVGTKTIIKFSDNMPFQRFVEQMIERGIPVEVYKSKKA
ncbi:hypothetical protein M2454_002446 [Aequitasia blattaphilus]|uniref:DUF5673 domain-containing protein n=1 Tax=Aequitasia blattaphilus TaxID=2949332 RepID=A0ABT1EBM3_9FIRM|nr:DUF6560 family protein [Aequitasia blattaphilus]MCP1103076.1 hypothetical protein [Aequitasia blattaphilus]MCR8615716.1 hypothetical protein [Aequitasia blattaphilus]